MKPLPPDVLAKVLAQGVATGVNPAALGLGDGSDLGPMLAVVAAAGLPAPAAEVRFAPPRMWRFDLAWPAERVAFEREGGAFRPVRCDCGRVRTVFVSRHHSRDGMEGDVQKYNRAAVLGWLVIRATPGLIADGTAAADLIEALKSRKTV